MDSFIKGVKFSARAVLVLFILLIFSGSLLLLFSLESNSNPSAPTPISSSQAKQAADYVKRLSRQILHSRQTVTLKSNESELNSLLALTNRTYSRVIGTVDIQPDNAEFAVSIKLDIASMAFFLNCRALLSPSKDGIRWRKGRIGKIHFPDKLSNFVFRNIVKLLLGKRYGSSILESVSHVEFEANSLKMDFSPPKDFQNGFAGVARRLSAYSGQTLNFNTNRVQHYLDLITAKRSQWRRRVSLDEPLYLLFSETRIQSRKNGFAASEENMSALFALAIYVAPNTFKHFVANINTSDVKNIRPQFRLRGRHDLAKHFVYSAALKILAEQGISFSLGETKEIIDSNSGGSGFSFADIAADKAGIRFAQVATDNAFSAELLQEYFIGNIRETDFFPSLAELPEGLNETEFKKRFSDVESEKYLAVLGKIDERINATPILGIAF